jgi:hypothetical protein
MAERRLAIEVARDNCGSAIVALDGQVRCRTRKNSKFAQETVDTAFS